MPSVNGDNGDAQRFRTARARRRLGRLGIARAVRVWQRRLASPARSGTIFTAKGKIAT